LLMAAASLSLLLVAGPSIDPTLGREIPAEAVALSWLGVGMSILWQGWRERIEAQAK